MTPEQRRAVALANARLRLQQQQQAGATSAQDSPFARLITGEAQPSAPQSLASGVYDQVTQGAAFGWGDELTGLEAGLLGKTTDGKWFDYSQPFGERYREGRDWQRARNEAFQAERPVTSLVAQGAGGLAMGLGLARGGMTLMNPTMSLPTAVGAGVVEGGLYGAFAGAGGAREGERLAGAAGGAVTGGALGGGATLAIGGGAAGLTAARNAFSNNVSAARMGMSPTSGSILRRSMEADGSLAGPGAANIAAAGPDAMLADAGPNARSILDTAIQRSGQAGTVARNAIDARTTQARASLDQGMDTAFGRESAMLSASPETRAQIRSAYNEAYSTPINYAGERGQQLERTLRRIPYSIVRRANELMQVEGEESAQILARVTDDGSVTFERQPDVRQIDYMTRALQTVSRRGDGQGIMGGNTPEGRAYGSLARELRDLVRGEVPAYGTALDTASTEIGKIEARNFGRTLLSSGTSRADAAEEIAGLSAVEKRFAAVGVREQFDDTLANVQRAVTDGNMDAREAVSGLRLLSSRANREKITLLVGEEQANTLFNQIEQATYAMELRASVAQNSKTFARQATNEMVRGQTDDGALNALRSGEPINATKRIVQILGGRTEADRIRQQEQTYEELARILTERRGQSAAQTLSGLQSYQPPIRPPYAGVPSGSAGAGADPLRARILARQR